MKTTFRNAIRLSILIIFMSGFGASYAQNASDAFVTITGQLKDAKTGDKIVYATVSVPGTGVGTVSNSDGEFILKISKSVNAEYFEVSHLSYTTTKFKVSEYSGKDKTLLIEPQTLMLKEVTIIPNDARSLVASAMKNIKKNYSEVPNMMTGFYRETIRQRREYISL